MKSWNHSAKCSFERQKSQKNSSMNNFCSTKLFLDNNSNWKPKINNARIFLRFFPFEWAFALWFHDFMTCFIASLNGYGAEYYTVTRRLFLKETSCSKCHFLSFPLRMMLCRIPSYIHGWDAVNRRVTVQYSSVELSVIGQLSTEEDDSWSQQVWMFYIQRSNHILFTKINFIHEKPHEPNNIYNFYIFLDD